MKTYKQSFERAEIKYMLNEFQYLSLRQYLADYTVPDQYGKSEILNIYYDTPDSRIIRTSLEKPMYKEKLRLRCYCVPDKNSPAFVELKKKFNGIVYKRRISLPYGQAIRFLNHPEDSASFSEEDENSAQIHREIQNFCRLYPNLRPAMIISYRRIALVGRDDPDFRITFDSDITARVTELTLEAGRKGEELLPGGSHLMEIKVDGAVPLPLSKELSRLSIFQSSYSKYGTGYLSLVAPATRLGTQTIRKRFPKRSFATSGAPAKEMIL
ncbi:MAG: polyphosphate polymerase domain-containing protein [Bilifractor sp.]|jgi:hypothetical protein